MDKGWSSLSVERFAAYLDGNLSPEEMNDMEMLIAGNPEMEDLVQLSDSIDEQILRLEFEGASDAPSNAFLDSDDFEIPDLDALDNASFEAVAFENDEPGNELTSEHPTGSDSEGGTGDTESPQPEESCESGFRDSPDAPPEDGFHQGEDFPDEI